MLGFVELYSSFHAFEGNLGLLGVFDDDGGGFHWC